MSDTAGRERQPMVLDAPMTADPETATRVARVLLVDDHRAFAEALAFAIDGQPDLACVGTPTTIAECLELVAEEGPDVVLLDVYLPDGDGIEAIPAIRARHADARVVVMTGHTDLDLMTRAAASGASGFLPKESSIAAVLGALRTVRDGQMLIDGTTLAAILGRVRGAPPAVRGSGVAAAKLTAREQDVLDLMGEGLDSHSIARHLEISLHTCRGYQKSILAKLDVHSQLEAVVVAARRGMIARVGR